jgi:predicted ATPase
LTTARADQTTPSLSVSAERFGPVSHGEISLRPLTIFIGPNNSGKSYLAMLIHSILRSHSRARFGLLLPTIQRRFNFAEVVDPRPFLSDFQEQMSLLSGSKSFDPVELPRALVQRIASPILNEIYETRLTEELVGAFACNLRDLVSVGSDHFALKLKTPAPIALASLKRKLRIESYPETNLTIRLAHFVAGRPPSPFATTALRPTENGFTVELRAAHGESKLPLALNALVDVIELVGLHITAGLGRPSHYLPAARSGILQGHRALAASVVDSSRYVGLRKLEIPPFSGVVAEFISTVLTLPSEKGPLYKLAKEFEKDLIRGEIILRARDKYRYPEIKYRVGKNELPLHRASSTVSEIAPLIIMMKYGVFPGSVLIIEEPEAHLHPKNQIILARYLARLVRRNVTVLLTTHSEFLLEQLSSFMLLSRLEPSVRAQKYHHDPEDYLKFDEVGVYVFSESDNPLEHTVRPVEISQEDGISQDEFIKVHEALYDEGIRLRRQLSPRDDQPSRQ